MFAKKKPKEVETQKYDSTLTYEEEIPTNILELLEKNRRERGLSNELSPIREKYDKEVDKNNIGGSRIEKIKKSGLTKARINSQKEIENYKSEYNDWKKKCDKIEKMIEEENNNNNNNNTKINEYEERIKNLMEEIKGIKTGMTAKEEEKRIEKRKFILEQREKFYLVILLFF